MNDLLFKKSNLDFLETPPHLPSPLYIASDHAGFDLKTRIQENLRDEHWIDMGPSHSEKVDYPDYVSLLVHEMKKLTNTKGVLICGTGIGVSIAANRFSGIRAACVDNLITAKFSRSHNDSNILCLGARILALNYALEILKVWLSTPFEPGEQHQHLKRIQKIENLEGRQSQGLK